MSIEGISAIATPIITTATAATAGSIETDPGETAPEPVDEIQTAGEGDEAAPAGDGEEEIPGVLRHLRNDHFSGVAALRLRINFATQLAELERLDAEAATTAGVEAIGVSIDAEIDALLGSDGIDEEQAAAIEAARETLTEAISDATADFLDGEEIAPGGLDEGLEGALGAFAGEIDSILNPEPPAEEAEPAGEIPGVAVAAASGESGAAEETGEADPAEDSDPAAAFAEFIERLNGGFESALDELNAALTEATAEPDLPEARGNGRSYEKFLEAYNTLQGDAPAADAPGGEEPEPALDVAA